MADLSGFCKPRGSDDALLLYGYCGAIHCDATTLIAPFPPHLPTYSTRPLCLRKSAMCFAAPPSRMAFARFFSFARSFSHSVHQDFTLSSFQLHDAGLPLKKSHSTPVALMGFSLPHFFIHDHCGTVPANTLATNPNIFALETFFLRNRCF